MSRAFGDYDYKSNGELSRGRQAVVCAPEVEARERDGEDSEWQCVFLLPVFVDRLTRIPNPPCRFKSRGAKDDLQRSPSARQGGSGGISDVGGGPSLSVGLGPRHERQGPSTT